ncbi:MAG: FadR/GntR family transcriptional regulator [Granulosicoccus sp.]
MPSSNSTALNDPDMPASADASQRLEWGVHEGLLKKIRDGSYALGQRLPSETALASEYGVSRPIVRNALARLRESGLVKSRQGAGSFVCNGEQELPSGYAPLGSIEDISRYFSYRRLIECQAAADAATHIDTAGVRRLEVSLEQIQQLFAAQNTTIDPDVQFHLCIAELSGNRFLFESLQMLRSQMYFVGKFVRGLSMVGYRKGKQAMSAEHQRIVEAIASGNAKTASTTMRQHLQRSERRIFKGQ